MYPAARFRTPWVDDEFAEVVRTAREWLRDNSCPDESLGQHFVTVLDGYHDMTNATVARVMDLRVIIEQEVRSLDYWKPPGARAAPSSDIEIASTDEGTPRESSLGRVRAETASIPTKRVAYRGRRLNRGR
jgi:hypothetical protein